MSTRSSISVFNPETNKWVSIYCHFDGYFSHVGRLLVTHYATLAKALELVSEGDLSVLGASCEKPEGHSFDTPAEGYCIYYGRDRGEHGTKAWIGESLSMSPKTDQDYCYLFKNDDWFSLQYKHGQEPLKNYFTE